MKTNTASRRFGLRLLVTSILAVGTAAANSIVVTDVDWNRGASIWIQEDGTPTSAYFAGVIDIAVNAGQTYYRDSLCVDLFTDINIGGTYGTTILRPDQVTGKNLDRVSWLIDNALLPTQDNTY